MKTLSKRDTFWRRLSGMLLVGMSTALMSFMPGDGNQRINHFEVKNVSLKDAVRKLEKQTDMGFFYEPREMDQTKGITVDARNLTLRELLQRLLVGTGFKYEIVDGNVVITREKKRLVSQADMMDVRVTVVDAEDKQPLIGATVMVHGTTQGAATDMNGQVNLQNVTDNQVLDITYVGKKTTHIWLQKGKKSYSIELADDAHMLQQLDVVTGYQTIESGRATGSFDILKQEDLHNVVSGDVVNNLEAIVPGLTVDREGNMMLRGQATIYSDTKPLVVVDGFPMEYGTYNINPNDIDQITVLKDAASASIWGVRAANGVIVINTKKGRKNQKASVSYNGNVKLGSRFDVSSLGYFNSQQQIDLEREWYANRTTIDEIGAGSTNYFTEAAMIEHQYRTGQLSADQRDVAYTKLGSYTNSKDIEREFYRSSLYQSHNVTLSAGSQNTTNYLSVNLENSLGDLKGNSENHFTAQLNSTFDITQKLKLSTGFRANYARKHQYTGSPTSMKPYVGLADNEYYGISQLVKDDLQSKGYLDWSYNRLQDRDQVSDKTDSYNIAVNAMLDWQLPAGFRVSTSGMYIVDHAKQDVHNSLSSYHVRDLYNQFTAYDEITGVLTSYLPEGGIKEQTQNNSTSYTWRNVLNYKFDNEQWNVSAMAGMELFSIRTKTENNTFYGYDPQGMTYASAMNLQDLVSTGVIGYSPTVGYIQLWYNPYHRDNVDRYFSYFATASGTYLDRYTLFGSIRKDKTNLYGRSSKYRDQPTWSVGGRWDVSKVAFFHMPHVDRLALKMSYGLSGNVNKSTSPYLIAAAARDMFTGQNTLVIQNPENPELGWEKVYTWNVGIDLNLFKNRVNLNAEYYNRKTNDALGMSTMDPTTGWSNVLKNASSLVNQGIDLSLNVVPVQTQNVSWSSTLNFSYNYNKVTDVNTSASTFNSLTNGDPIEGKPVDYVFSFRSAPLDSEGNLQIVNAQGETSGFEAINSYNINDVNFVGRLSPKYYGSWINSVSYKNFTFDMMFTYKLGHKMHMPSIANVYLSSPVYKEFDKRWRQPGDEATTHVPRSVYGTVGGSYLLAMENIDWQIESANVIRLKTIGLSYDFSSLLKKSVITSLNAKLTVENPWFWASNRDNLDPDRMINDTNNSTYLGDSPTYYALILNIGF